MPTTTQAAVVPQSPPRHPLALAREVAGLTKAELARRSGASYGALCHAEAGIYERIGTGVLPALALLGLDRDALQADHERWRASQRGAP